MFFCGTDILGKFFLARVLFTALLEIKKSLKTIIFAGEKILLVGFTYRYVLGTFLGDAVSLKDLLSV